MSDQSDLQLSQSSSGGTSRRRLLTLMGAGGAAVLASQLPRKDALAGHDATNIMHLGEKNFTPATALNGTTVITANATTWVLEVENTSTAEGAGGMQVFANGGGAIQGNATGPANSGVAGYSWSSEDAGIGQGAGDGVVGKSGSGNGVVGASESTGTGVFALCLGAGKALKAHAPAPGAIGLEVIGRSTFSTAGSASVPAGQNSVFVANAAVTGDSHISVTLSGNPGLRGVHWVDRNPGSGFTLHLLSGPGPKPATPFTYLIVEPTA